MFSLVGAVIYGQCTEPSPAKVPTAWERFEPELTLSGRLPMGMGLTVYGVYRTKAEDWYCSRFEFHLMKFVDTSFAYSLAEIVPRSDGTFDAKMRVRPSTDAGSCRPRFVDVEIFIEAPTGSTPCARLNFDDRQKVAVDMVAHCSVGDLYPVCQEGVQYAVLPAIDRVSLRMDVIEVEVESRDGSVPDSGR